MKNKILMSVGIIAVAAMFFAIAPAGAQAAVSWNDGALMSKGNVPMPCSTVTIGNSSTGQNGSSTCWGPSISASAGDTIKVRINYVNTGSTAAAGSMLYLNAPSGTSNSFTFTGSVSGGGAQANGSASVSINGAAQSLTYVGAQWYPEHATQVQTASGSPASGFSIGTIGTWDTCPTNEIYCHSGYIIATYRVSSNSNPTSTCAITSFSANPSQVSSGSASYLSWNTSNCTNVSISGGSLYGAQPTSGTTSTGALSTSTTYTLTASGPSNTDTRQTTVTVTNTPPPSTCAITSFYATPTSVTSGQASTLVWNTSGCTTASLSGGGISDTRLGGSTSTGPLSNGTSYTLTASSGSNTVTQTVFVSTVQTQQCAITSFYATPTQVNSGASSTLYWTTNGCTSANVSGSGVYSSNLSGSVSTGSIYGTNTYTLTASGTNTVSQTVTVTATTQNNQCSIVTFYASPTNIPSGSNTTLYWTTTGCNTATVSGNGVYSSALSGSVPTGAIYGVNSYTLTAYGSNTVTQTVAVSAGQNNQCYINSFYASPTTVSSGGSTNIYWSTSGGNGNIVVSGPGVYSTQSSGSTNTGPIYNTSTYTITGNCGYGYYGNNINQTITVTVDSPTGVTPVTTVPTNIGSSSARLNGFIQSLNANQYQNVSAYFEYGTSASLGSQTSGQSVNTNTLTNYFDTISVSPNTTYYYRAAAIANGITYRGSIVSFTTPGVTVINTNTNTNTTVTTTTTNTNVNRQVLYGTGGGSPLVMLDINNQLQTFIVGGQVQQGFGQFGTIGNSQVVYAGDTITYYVHYKNISNVSLTNAVLNVVLPVDVAFKQTTLGVLTTNNTVAASLGTLAPGQEGAITIAVETSPTAVAGTTLVATATLAFTTPSGAQDSAVAYALTTIGTRTSSLAGLALFGYGFFPTTLIGWIILLGLIVIIILIARHYYYRRPTTVVYNNNNHGPSDMHH